MGKKADDLKARYEAEIAQAELEDELVAAKKKGDPKKVAAVSEKLREARYEQRTAREQENA